MIAINRLLKKAALVGGLLHFGVVPVIGTKRTILRHICPLLDQGGQYPRLLLVRANKGRE